MLVSPRPPPACTHFACRAIPSEAGLRRPPFAHTLHTLIHCFSLFRFDAFATKEERILLRDKSTPMGTVNTILTELEKHILNRIEKGYKDKHMAVPARLRTTKLLANSAHFSACQILPSSFTFQAFRRGETVSGFASSLVGRGRVSVRPVLSGQKRYAERGSASDSDREEIDLLSGSDDRDR